MSITSVNTVAGKFLEVPAVGVANSDACTGQAGSVRVKWASDALEWWRVERIQKHYRAHAPCKGYTNR